MFRLRRPARPAGLILLGSLLAAGCGNEQQQSAAPSPPPKPAVGVMAVEQAPVTPSAAFTGRIAAVDVVDLRARINGFLEQREFAEGQEVKAGDLLFVIEKQQYEAAVAQAQAQVAQADASLKDAELQLQRGQQLVRNSNIPQADVDTRQATRDSASGQLLAARAALQQAQINLGYTDIKAPIAGKIGRSAPSVGDYLTPDSGALATIVSQDPIYVTFPVTSRQLLDVQREAQANATDPRDVVVHVRLADGSLYDQAGRVNFVDNRVDPTTDSVIVRASLPNPQRRLVDSALVSVVVEAAKPQEALVVPQASVLSDQNGTYLLVVGGDGKVEQRRVGLGDPVDTNVVVQSGVRQGEKVIVDGLQKVRAGQEVEVSEVPSAKPPGQG